MKILKGIKNFLTGKKTFIVGLLMICLGILNGENQMVLEGIGLITLRVGVSSR